LASDTSSIYQLLERAPGPSPWWCRHPIQSALGPLRWKPIEKPPVNLLVDVDDHPRLALPMYVWFQPLDDGKMLLWRRQTVPPTANASIVVQLISLDQLRRIQDLNDWLDKSPKPDQPHFSTAPQFVAEFEFYTVLDAGKHSLILPAGFEHVPEFFVIADNPTLPALPGLASCCVYAINPIQQSVDVLPQDWFNEGGLDYGYQWITCIVRDPATGRLAG